MWFKNLWPPAVQVNAQERWRSALGAALGLLVLGALSRVLGEPVGTQWGLIAPLGASAVLLFALPASPMAQPWAVVVGNAASALVGICCARWVPNALLAAPLAVGLAIGAMFMLRCLHPPGAAMALLAVLGQHTAFSFALMPVLGASLLLVLVAALYNTATGRPYPHLSPHVSPQVPPPGAGSAIESARQFSHADLDAVLANYNQVLDVSRGDLEALLQSAEALSYQRRLGEIRCAQVMSQEVVTVQFGDALADAWTLMRQRRIKALPVVDKARRVVGILTMSDFLRHADMQVLDGLGGRLREFVRPTGRSSSAKPEAVGQIMSRTVRVASSDRFIVDLIPLFSQHGHHHIPIVDAEKRLVGIITQTDVVRALFRAVESQAGR